MKKCFFTSFILGVASAFLIPISAEAAEPPNVVIILADDLGYGDVGANNPDSRIPTPAMDRVAAEGIRFTDGHSPSAVCTPTRYALLTGRYCWRTRLKSGVLWGIDPSLMDPKRSTIASMLKAKGYRTACIGKWHLGMDFRDKNGRPLKNDRKLQEQPGIDPVDYSKPVGNSPLTYGFHESFIITGSLNMYPYAYIDGDRFTQAATDFKPRTAHNITIISGGPKAPDFDFEAVVDTFNRRAVKFIRESAAAKKPFFLYFPLTSPHKPVIPSARFKGKSEYGIYGDFVIETDDAVGQILKVLDKTKQADNTIVVVTSDNGSFMFRIDEGKPDHIEDFSAVGYHPKHHQSNHIWRGTKADIYEGGHRVPLLVRWPSSIKAGSVSDHTTTLTDWFATISELVDHRMTDGEGEDSFSLVPLLKGNGTWQRAPVINHSINGTFAIRDGRWKLIAGSGSGGRQAPRGKPFERPYQLYDLTADPSERNNLIRLNPQLAKALEKKLDDIRDAGRSR
jgi:arylsulfatase A-like enzyme|tara:strand:+ start:812 stop:2335 length:1524 start_codon:yes stop_codon:yes gene_type:complete